MTENPLWIWTWPWWAYVLAAAVAVVAVVLLSAYARAAVPEQAAEREQLLERVSSAAHLLAMTDVPWQSVAMRYLLDRPEGVLANNAYGAPSSVSAPVPVPAKAVQGLGPPPDVRAHGVRFGRGGKNEERCRQLLEFWFGVSFPTHRPGFLKWKTGRNLELDMYNETLGLAVEYDGIMHRRFHPSFHRTYADFLYQQAKDTWKDERCREVGVTLVRVPDTVHYEDLPAYLLGRVQAAGYSIHPPSTVVAENLRAAGRPSIES